MARNAAFAHATQVNASTYPDDGTSPVGTTEWNEDPDQAGMLGITPTNSTRTIASGVVTPTDSICVVAAESSTSDTLDKIAIANTNQYDFIYLFADTGDTITLTHTASPSADGHIFTVSGANETLSTTKPTILIRKGTYWYGYGGGTVSDGSITTAKLAADAVTGAKLADDALDSEHYTDASIDTAHIANLQITTGLIAADAITAAKLADDVVDSEHLAAGGIDTEHLGALQVTTAKIAADAITAAKIGDNVIDSEHYAAASIDNEHLADDAVGADELASNAVVNASVASGAAIATSKLSGAVTGIASHGLATSATTDTTSASNVTSGTLPNAQLPDIVVADLAAAAVTLESEGIASNDNDTSFPTSAAVKDFVDTAVASDITLKGNYNASTDSPSLDDGSPIAGITKGDHYVVSAAGDFFSETMQIGDSIIANQDSPTTASHWITVNNNMVTPIVTGNIAADAITGAKIADDAIDSEHYTDASIDTAHIGNLQVTTGLIAADAITSAKIADDQIDSEHYAAGSIDTAHIADDQITLAKMAGGTDGELITYDASGDPAAVAVGTATHVLTSNGVGVAPTFQAAAGGGVTADVDYSGLWDIFDLQRLSLENQASSFDTDGTNNPAISNETTLYARAIDSNNDGIFCRVKKNGANVYLQIA